MLVHHRLHALHGRRADALLLGLAVDHVTGRGHRDTGQAGDITEFQVDDSCYAEPFHRTGFKNRRLSSNVPVQFSETIQQALCLLFSQPFRRLAALADGS
ncbi:hypothetical protein D3C72_2170530 [compost metagenome]